MRYNISLKSKKIRLRRQGFRDSSSMDGERKGKRKKGCIRTHIHWCTFVHMYKHIRVFEEVARVVHGSEGGLRALIVKTVGWEYHVRS